MKERTSEYRKGYCLRRIGGKTRDCVPLTLSERLGNGSVDAVIMIETRNLSMNGTKTRKSDNEREAG
jgi:hypothetical protein